MSRAAGPMIWHESNRFDVRAVAIADRHYNRRKPGSPQFGRRRGEVMGHLVLLAEIGKELSRAQDKFPPFNSPHEGYAVILEELDELWDEVRDSGPSRLNRLEMRREAIQVAAMALRFIVDICDPDSAPEGGK